MTVSKEDVTWCYRTLLRREPESTDAIAAHLKADSWQTLVSRFIFSEEFKIKSRAQTTAEMCLLQPDALELTKEPKRRLKIAVLGTCVAQTFVNFGPSDEFELDHFLMQSHRPFAAPRIDWAAYDGVVVHITLRALLGDAVGRTQDLFHLRLNPDFADIVDQVKENLQKLLSTLEQAIKSLVPTFFLSFIEPSSTAQGILLNNRSKSLYRLVRTLNDELAAAVDGFKGCYYTEINDLVRYYGDRFVSDSYVEQYTHAGFAASRETEAVIASVLRRIRNSLSIVRGEDPIKLIITDLDNTLWKGVVAELDDISSDEHWVGWPLGYVEALLEFKRRGGLLAISSKNEEGPTISRFKRIWDERLRIEDFCSIKISWNPKSAGIAEILSETNLLESNVLFVDDNPREIEEVRRIYPRMRFLTGDQKRWRCAILHSPQTQVAAISKESERRSELVKAKQQRDRMASEMDHDAYLKSLDITVRIDVLTAADHGLLDRALELINKTNQFNTTGARRSLAEIEALFASGGSLVSLSASDKFGDNGLVAVAVLSDQGIAQVVMSCRVFGLGLEIALLNRAIEILSPTGTENVYGYIQANPKNKTSLSYFKENGFKETPGTPGTWILVSRAPFPDWIKLGK